MKDAERSRLELVQAFDSFRKVPFPSPGGDSDLYAELVELDGFVAGGDAAGTDGTGAETYRCRRGSAWRTFSCGVAGLAVTGRIPTSEGSSLPESPLPWRGESDQVQCQGRRGVGPTHAPN